MNLCLLNCSEYLYKFGGNLHTGLTHLKVENLIFPSELAPITW